MSSYTWPGSSHDDAAPVAVILPGTGYTAKAPLLYWSAVLLCQQGWHVRAVEWDFASPPEVGAQSVVEGEVERAGDVARGGRIDLVVAKSFGSLALPWAVANSLAGVWLTPVLTEAPILDALTRATSAHLAIGGSRDPLWTPAKAVLTQAVFQTVEGADHSLVIADDWWASLDLQRGLHRRIAEHARGIR